MIPFPEALRLMLEAVPPTETERISIRGATGRVLREPVAADRPFPPFDRVMMDGYALRSRDHVLGIRVFTVTGTGPAGHAAPDLTAVPGSCVEIMTGAPLPAGADCVIPVEETVRADDGGIHLTDNATVAPGRNIHRAGSDAAGGETLLAPGTVLGARQIGAAASCGAAVLSVSGLPRIAVFATGDELVDVEAMPLPWQIRQSNAHAILAALSRAGYPAKPGGTLPDDPAESRRRIANELEQSDWIVLTGAISKGARDFIPRVLDLLGCKRLFHGIAQRPGKPAGCWIPPAGGVIAALPGNPVSALTCLHALVLPALAKASGQAPSPPAIFRTAGPVRRLAGFTHHLPVVLAGGQASPAPAGNSGDFTGLLRSDGFLTLPPVSESVDSFRFTPWL